MFRVLYSVFWTVLVLCRVYFLHSKQSVVRTRAIPLLLKSYAEAVPSAERGILRIPWSTGAAALFRSGFLA